jgi:hypothetical protein
MLVIIVADLDASKSFLSGYGFEMAQQGYLKASR